MVIIVVPISLSSLCVASKEGGWISQRLAWRAELPMPVSAVSEEPTFLEPKAPTITETLVSLPPSELDSSVVLVEITDSRPLEQPGRACRRQAGSNNDDRASGFIACERVGFQRRTLGDRGIEQHGRACRRPAGSNFGDRDFRLIVSKRGGF